MRAAVSRSVARTTSSSAITISMVVSRTISRTSSPIANVPFPGDPFVAFDRRSVAGAMSPGKAPRSGAEH